MAEDWNAIAKEVEGALKSIGTTDAGWPVLLRREVAGPGPNDWTPGTPVPTYYQFWAFQDYKRIRDRDGTLTDIVERTFYLTATAGVEPQPGDRLAFGATIANAATVGEDKWVAVMRSLPLAPVGIAVLHEVTLEE